MIGYQIYTRMHPPTPKVKTENIQTHFQEQKTDKHAFYTVNQAYRDPFLGKFPTKKTIRKKTIVSKNTTTVFPDIQYNGSVEGNKEKSYILTINGKQDIVKIKQVLQGVQLIKATENEISVKFKNELKKIKKQ
ncbi:MAG: hypothetical protein P8H93_03570 [Polaribacter sp.]|jgi:hypothetical protein|nr:hypothetical protein [Polaribacter sp.]